MAAVQSPTPLLERVQSFEAAAAIDETGVLVEIDSNGKVKEATSATAAIVGVAMETAASGAQVPIYGEFYYGRAGDAVSAGAFLTAEAGGRLVTTTTAGDSVVGVACPKGGSAADGDLFRVAALTSRY